MSDEPSPAPPDEPSTPAPRPSVDELRAAIRAERSTATAYALDAVEASVQRLAGEGVSGRQLVDLGCSFGTLGSYVAARLGIDEVLGVDRDDARMVTARGNGVRTIVANLDRDLPLPIDSGSASVVTSFGALEHLLWFDDFLFEAARLLEPRGWLLLSVPNLGSYVNRAALLTGYQPRDVEVARSVVPGILPTYRTAKSRRPVGHPHVATLRALRELLEHTGFTLVQAYGFAPDSRGAKRPLDALFNRFPAWSRRVLLLARRS